jgi:hypothetical protein
MDGIVPLQNGAPRANGPRAALFCSPPPRGNPRHMAWGFAHQRHTPAVHRGLRHDRAPRLRLRQRLLPRASGAHVSEPRHRLILFRARQMGARTCWHAGRQDAAPSCGSSTSPTTSPPSSFSSSLPSLSAGGTAPAWVPELGAHCCRPASAGTAHALRGPPTQVGTPTSRSQSTSWPIDAGAPPAQARWQRQKTRPAEGAGARLTGPVAAGLSMPASLAASPRWPCTTWVSGAGHAIAAVAAAAADHHVRCGAQLGC